MCARARAISFGVFPVLHCHALSWFSIALMTSEYNSTIYDQQESLLKSLTPSPSSSPTGHGGMEWYFILAIAGGAVVVVSFALFIVLCCCICCCRRKRRKEADGSQRDPLLTRYSELYACLLCLSCSIDRIYVLVSRTRLLACIVGASLVTRPVPFDSVCV